MIRSTRSELGGGDARSGRIFDVDERLKQLSAKDDNLERLSAVVDFELFRLIDRNNTAGDVWADTAYRSRKNEKFLASRLLRSQIHRKNAAFD